MPSLAAQKIIKTYSRQRKYSLYDDEPPTKRRRVETPIGTSRDDSKKDEIRSLASRSSSPVCDGSTNLSSPKEPTAIFSDEIAQSTPPSSPMQHHMSSPPPSRRRPMFSFLRKRTKPELLTKEPLSERCQNVPSLPKHTKKKRLVQMQLDLVSEVTKTCKVCGMEYIPSHADDAALHRKFHAVNVGGVDISRAISEKLKKNQVWVGGERSFIAVVSRRDPLALRNKAIEVLKVVNTELGAVPIPDNALWSQVRNSIVNKAQQPQEGNGQYPASDRFKAYLYIQGQKCVGACLAERIQEAFPVLGQDDASEATGQLPAASQSQSSSITIGNTTNPAILGVSRIWTSNLHRKHGIATRLLDSARSDFLYGMAIDKASVAFSQPTESGGQLAGKWFGQRAGWHVYID